MLKLYGGNISVCLSKCLNAYCVMRIACIMSHSLNKGECYRINIILPLLTLYIHVISRVNSLHTLSQYVSLNK